MKGENDKAKTIAEDEAVYQGMLNALPVGIVVTTPEGLIIETNRAFVEMFGYDNMGQMIELGAAELYDDPEDREEILAMLNEGTVTDYEARLKRKGGSCFWGSFHSIVKASGGGETRIYTALRDVTERREAEEWLHMLGMAVEQTVDGVIITDLDGRILFVNQAFAAMHRYRVSDLNDEYMRVLHTEDQLENECKVFNRELLMTGLHQGPVGRKRSDGSTFSTWTTGALLEDNNGRPVGFVKTVHDMTEQKATEERLRSINAELEGYAHAVAHDLKGPLSVIGASCTALRELLPGCGSGGIDLEALEALDMIDENLSRGFALIEDLLCLAESGREPNNMTDVSVRDVVERIVKERAKELGDRGVSVEADGDLGQVYANPTHVYQLFSNLMANAILHNDSTEPVVEVRHLGEDAAGTNSYIVRDNGQGIDPEEKDKIFLPFYSGKGHGAGLGLAIVAKIIGTYNGTIDAYNDNGACFEFSI